MATKLKPTRIYISDEEKILLNQLKELGGHTINYWIRQAIKQGYPKIYTDLMMKQQAISDKKAKREKYEQTKKMLQEQKQDLNTPLKPLPSHLQPKPLKPYPTPSGKSKEAPHDEPSIKTWDEAMEDFKTRSQAEIDERRQRLHNYKGDNNNE